MRSSLARKDPSGLQVEVDFVLGRHRFAQISAVEGISLTSEMRNMLARFDREGLTAAERRSAIVRYFTPAR